jgi:hypothetical protein
MLGRKLATLEGTLALVWIRIYKTSAIDEDIARNWLQLQDEQELNSDTNSLVDVSFPISWDHLRHNFLLAFYTENRREHLILIYTD